MPSEQVCKPGHTRPQLPQLRESVLTLTSQPSPLTRLQSAKPALHEAMPHAPDRHVGAPFATTQARPQPPQLLTLVVVLTSQPSPDVRLQSAKPALHATPHARDWHRGAPFGTARQTRPQRPQLLTSMLMSASQPLNGMPSQLAKPALHDTVHILARHMPVPFRIRSHWRPQPPQFEGLLAVLTSQPLDETKSQSA